MEDGAHAVLVGRQGTDQFREQPRQLVAAEERPAPPGRVQNDEPLTGSDAEAPPEGFPARDSLEYPVEARIAGECGGVGGFGAGEAEPVELLRVGEDGGGGDGFAVVEQPLGRKTEDGRWSNLPLVTRPSGIRYPVSGIRYPVSLLLYPTPCDSTANCP
ncbi:hypothetical protein [Streptomyces sp. ISL-98]|uniref:hypothetical protein n=1 Tax=Streptomyces sp. ISL-98 TaxID=2819192 RepID=UPI0027E45685|nr:hypothetical protein [Streptomyces sp. ISL-98]